MFNQMFAKHAITTNEPNIPSRHGPGHIQDIKVPASFNWNLYISIVKHRDINNDITAFTHFSNYCIPNNILYKTYYRTLYNVPPLLIEDKYITYLDKVYKIKYPINEYKDLYLFYNEYGKVKCPLNDAYFRIYYNIPEAFSLDSYNKRFNQYFIQTMDAYKHFDDTVKTLDEEYHKIHYNIPKDFSIEIYNKRYNFIYKANDVNDAYKFFCEKGITDYSLDDEYYRIYYGIPEEFSLEPYNKVYGYTFTRNKDAYKFFKGKGKSLDDETYLKARYNITDSRFNWKAYASAYLTDKATIQHVYKHFGNHEYKSVSPLNEPYLRKLYNLPDDFSIEEYIRSTHYLFKDDPYYILDVYTHKITLNDIYSYVKDKSSKNSVELNFMKDYEFLSTFTEISSEKDKRYYIHLRKFIEDYYPRDNTNNNDNDNNDNNDKIFKTIERIRYVTTIEKQTVVKRVKVPSSAKQNESLSKLMNMMNKFNVPLSSLPVSPEELKHSHVEDSYKDVTEVKDVEVTKEIVDKSLERYYDSLYFDMLTSKKNVLNDIRTTASKLYYAYTFKHYFEDYNYIEKFSENNAIFIALTNYPHIPIIFRNNISKLGKGWSHTVVCCLSNETMIRNMCIAINNNINVVVLPFSNITFNELNNTLLNKSFWNDNILGENLIIYNENILFKNKDIRNLLNSDLLGNIDCLGYEIPRVFTYNNGLNGYSDITFRKKSLVLETLEHLVEIEIINSLCKEIQAHFTLDNIPEDMIYSYYVFNIKHKDDSNDSNISEDYLQDNKYFEALRENIKSLAKSIIIVNYKFHNINNCSLESHISEFIKKSTF
jgi:hypothetical protein